jgi:hypothetical protein
MRLRWWIFATFSGALVAAVIWLWPVAPIWRSGPGSGYLQGMSPDGRVLITTTLDMQFGRNGEPQIFRWDTETGELISKVSMKCSDPASYMYNFVWPSGDGLLALVGEGTSSLATVSGSLGYKGGTCYVHDGITGQRLTGPIQGVISAPRQPFSQDGKWFIGGRGDPKVGFSSMGGADIYATNTGERVIALPDRDGSKATTCLFAPDSATVAVCWSPIDKKDSGRPTRIEILELPSGKVLRQFDLPSRHWLAMDRWDGQRLTARDEAAGEPPDGRVWQGWVFDTSADPIGTGVADPLLQGGSGPKGLYSFWVEGRDCVGIGRIVVPNPEPSWLDSWRDWVAAQTGLDISSDRQRGVSVKILSRSDGETRYTLPRLVGLNISISPDGRRLACFSKWNADGIEVWDIDPPPRWPWALAAAVGVGGVFLAIGRWRRKREMMAMRHARGGPLPDVGAVASNGSSFTI